MNWELSTILIVLGFGMLSYIAVKSGEGYPPERAEMEAESYAGIISEAKGRITPFLYITYAAVLLWSLVYLYLHAKEFAALL